MLERWCEFIRDIQLDRIGRPHVIGYLATILERGRTRRTRNIRLSIFRNLLRHFADKGLLIEVALPTAGIKLTPKREFPKGATLKS